MSDPVRQLVEALEAQAPLKLWSVLVSCLGDVSRDVSRDVSAGGAVEVSGVALSALVERVGLQPQAMRVALHRLKRDGWVESRRDGRVGFHRLSGSALAQAGRVAERIYGPAAGPDGWHLVGMPQGADEALDGLPEGVSALVLPRGLALVSGPLEKIPEDWLVTVPGPRGLPSWLREIVAEAACETEFKALEGAIAAIGALPEAPLDRFALRVLVLHGWRRLALRSNPAAEAALGAGRAEIPCRTAVHGMLKRVGPVQAAWLREVA